MLLAREGSWKLWCVPGLSLLPGAGPQPGSPPHLWAAFWRVPRADEGERKGAEGASRAHPPPTLRSGAAARTPLSTDSRDPPAAGAENTSLFIICNTRHPTPQAVQRPNKGNPSLANMGLWVGWGGSVEGTAKGTSCGTNGICQGWGWLG